MNKYKSKYKKLQSLPQYGWGSTIGGIAGGALGTLLGPFGSMAGSSLGAALGNAIDGEENTQGNQVQMPQLNIDPVNTQQFYNPVKAYGGYMYPGGGNIQTTQLTPQEEIAYKKWKKTIPKNLQYEGDYDLRGFYKENPNWSASNPKVHMGDKFKLPNHSTFSNESMYYNYQTSPQGGSWKGNDFMPNDPLNPKFLDSNNPEVFTRINKFPFGGQINPNAEVEGDEVIQYQPGMQPQAIGQGSMQQIASDMSVAQGPTHANGGVPISAAPGSMVVSNRLPAPNTKEYKSIANKVEMLGRKKGQLEKKIKKNPNDKIAKDTIGLVQKQIDTLIQQQEQMKVQNSQAIIAKAYQKAFGGTVTGNERVDKDFLNIWNTGSYAYGGRLPKFDGINNPSSYIDPFSAMPFEAKANGINWNNYIQRDNTLIDLNNKGLYPNLRPEDRYVVNENTEAIKNNNLNVLNSVPITMNDSGFKPNSVSQDFGINGMDNYSTPNFKKYQFNAQPTTISGKYNEFGQNKYGIDNASLGVKSNINAPYLKGGNPTTNESMMQAAKISNKPGDKKVPLKENTFGNNLQYAAQYIPDIIASFTKKDKPIDPNMYMNQSRVNAARYDTSAEEAAVQDARNQAMLLAKETSGGDAGMYANLGNVANTGAYKNLGQVYNRAQNINMQNQMAADQANAGIEGQNRSMALNIANMNQADASAVEDRRMAGMQGIANKLANQYSQDRQFKLLKDIAPHYNYNEKNGELTFNGKKYYGEEAKTLLEQLKMNASNAFNKVLGFGQNIFGGI